MPRVKQSMTDKERRFVARLAARITRLRLARGWTLQALGAQVGIDKSNQLKRERGEAIINYVDLLRYGKAFGRPVKELVS